MRYIGFQTLAIGIILLSIVQSIRRQRKSRDMPFKTYWFSYAIGAWCAGCLMYGIIFFVDAPIRQSTPQEPCANTEFCGKGGTPHTREEFEAFMVWQKVLLLSWLLGVPTLWIASWTAKKQKASSSTSSEG
jgi:hypothetical protein